MKEGLPETALRFVVKGVAKTAIGFGAVQVAGMAINGFKNPQRGEYDSKAMPLANIATNAITYAPVPGSEYGLVNNARENFVGGAYFAVPLVLYLAGHWLWQKTSKHEGKGWGESETGTAARRQKTKNKKAKAATAEARKLQSRMSELEEAMRQ
ncbi:MAG: hypothetical protein KKB31_06775 [Nanoarchaeota archaeon]|nr:hypothetical protein [Nanoarchaeota archaeon]